MIKVAIGEWARLGLLLSHLLRGPVPLPVQPEPVRPSPASMIRPKGDLTTTNPLPPPPAPLRISPEKSKKVVEASSTGEYYKLG